MSTLSPNFDASQLLGVDVSNGSNDDSTPVVTFSELPTRIVSLFKRSYPRGKFKEKAAFLTTCIEFYVNSKGGKISDDGRILPLPVEDPKVDQAKK